MKGIPIKILGPKLYYYFVTFFFSLKLRVPLRQRQCFIIFDVAHISHKPRTQKVLYKCLMKAGRKDGWKGKGRKEERKAGKLF